MPVPERAQRHPLLPLLLVLALLAGGAVAPAAQAPAAGTHPLAIETAFGRLEFAVELASTPAERARGLMYREHLAPRSGMLFDFETVRPVTMWMRNTYVPLDMLFIAADGRIKRIARDTTPLSEAVIASEVPVRAVLELPAGTAASLGIRPGDRVLHPIFSGPPQ